MHRGGKAHENKSKQSSLSNYGSLLQNSSSSLSFSLSSMDEGPSTSGCSSIVAYRQCSVQMKKVRVKQYLKTLASLIGPTSTGSRMGTLSTLQHVVNSVCKMTDDKHLSCDRVFEGDAGQVLGSPTETKLTPNFHHKLSVILSMKKHVVQHVTQDLMCILDYPSDFWRGRGMTDFMYKRDVLTFNKNTILEQALDDISPMSHTDFSVPGQNEVSSKMFYIRLRRYKCLRQGYSLSRMANYVPFHVTLHTTTAEQAGLDMLSKDQKFIRLHLVQMDSPYLDNTLKGNLPETRTFSLRHNALCYITHIHSNGVLLLGYLPQDIIGQTIFEFFHPEDLANLYTVFQKVLKSKSSSEKVVSESRMRLKAFSGDWIEVENEWSCFIDPWSKKLELVMGLLKVVGVRGPVDVFGISQHQPEIPREKLLEAQEYRQLIFNLLNRAEPASEPVVIKQEPQWEHSNPGGHVSTSQAEASKTREKMLVEKFSQECEQDKQDAEEDTSASYNHLNYSQNIKRYLQSQCIQGEMTSPLSQNFTDDIFVPYVDDERVLYRDDHREGTICLPKGIESKDLNVALSGHPSYGSSTIVQVSDQREDTIPSPPHPDVMDESQSHTNSSVAQLPHTELTQEALRKHTKQQQKLLLQLARQERNLVARRKTGGQGKRSGQHNLDTMPTCEPTQNKVFKADVMEPPGPRMDSFASNSGLPMMPVSTSMMIPNKSQPIFSQVPMPGVPEFVLSNVQQMSTVQQKLPIYMQQIPLMQIDPSTGLATPVVPMYTNTPSLDQVHRPQGIQWPYFQQTGVSFIPQVMGGFYQSLTGMFQPIPMQQGSDNLVDPRGNPVLSSSSGCFTTTVTSTTANSRIGDGAKPKGEPTNPGDNNPADTSTGNETDSSLMYILEASSSINNSSSKETRREKMKLGYPRMSYTDHGSSQSSWMTGVKMTNQVEMRYQLPQRSMQNVLLSDFEKLKKMEDKNSLICDQLSELVTQISEQKNVMDEEYEYLMCENVKNEDGSDSDSSSCCSDHNTRIRHWRKPNKSRLRVSEVTRTNDDNVEDVAMMDLETASCDWQKEKYDENLMTDVQGDTNGNEREKNNTGVEKICPEKNNFDDEKNGMDEEKNSIDEEKNSSEEEKNSTEEDKISSDSDTDKNDMRKLIESDSNLSNVSKMTSDITPSDQRSSEEALSSMKELSSCSSKDPKDSPSDLDAELRTDLALVDSLFVRLPVKMHSRKRGKRGLSLPFWLQESEQSENIAKKFCMSPVDMEKILEWDKCFLDHGTQPDAVVEQFKELNQQINPKSASGQTKTTGNSEKEQETGPSFMIDSTVFEDLFIPTGGYMEKQNDSKDDPKQEQLMMLD